MRKKKKFSVEWFVIFGVVLLIWYLIYSFMIIPNKIKTTASNNIQTASITSISEANNIYMSSDKSPKLDHINMTQLPKSFNIGYENVIGGLYIPKTKTIIPIAYSLNKKAYNNTALALKPKQVFGENNYAIGSNSSKNKNIGFSTILKLEKKDKIFVTDKENIYLYTVLTKEKVDNTRTDFIDNVTGKKLLTLVTRYKNKDENNLIVVRAKLSAKASYDSSGTELQNIFGKQ